MFFFHNGLKYTTVIQVHVKRATLKDEHVYLVPYNIKFLNGYDNKDIIYIYIVITKIILRTNETLSETVLLYL